jgi:hypothetical protein
MKNEGRRLPVATLVTDAFRVLTFRAPSAAISENWQTFLGFGLLFTWLAGIGRYWDNPRAYLWQHLGLGSVAYVFCLAFLLWLLLLPLKPKLWSYRNVLVFVTLTSPPALLYAIPVERFMSLDAAQTTNAWFLAVVAIWRVALLIWFLKRVAGLSGGAIIVATMLPLTLIVVGLALLNLEHVIFSIMGGLRPQELSPNDLSYGIVTMLAFFSVLSFPFLLSAYACLAYFARRPGPSPRPLYRNETDKDQPENHGEANKSRQSRNA